VTIYAQAQAPEYVDVVVNAAADFDPATATVWALYAWDTRGSRKLWGHTMVEQTATRAVLRHTFAEDDVPVPGSYRLQVTCSTPAGPRRTFTQSVPAESV
jgi:hypothetical protein